MGTPRYRPLLRSATLRISSAWASKAAVYCARASAVEGQLHFLPGLGVFNLQLAFPGRFAILVRPDLQQNQLVPEIGQILERFFAVAVVEKIRDHQRQAALRIFRAELARALQEIRLRRPAASRSRETSWPA